MAIKAQDTNNWPEMFDGLFERLTGRNAEIAYDFDDFRIDVPSSTEDNSPQAHWKLNGTMKITTRDKAH